MSQSSLITRPIRMRDIAEMAGVHITAVSAVLSPRPANRARVSQETRERILGLAKRLNYRPHFHAQIMRKRKTGLIALIEFCNSEISSRRTSDAAYAVRSRGYQAMITNIFWHRKSGEGIGIREAVNSVLDAKVEGVILVMPTAGLDPACVHEIQDAGIPCVGFDGVYLPGISQVRADFAAGAEMLTRHLLQLGHRRLSFISSWGTENRDANSNWPVLERIEGFKTVIQQAGGVVVDGVELLGNLPASAMPVGATIIGAPVDWRTQSDDRAGYTAVKRLLQSGERPDALFCSNDHYALGALRACFEENIRVPEQMGLVGFAGEQFTEFMTPSLTTVNTLDSAASEAVLDMLVEMIKEQRPAREGIVVKMPCQLIVRESCGATPAGMPLETSEPVISTHELSCK